MKFTTPSVSLIWIKNSSSVEVDKIALKDFDQVLCPSMFVDACAMALVLPGSCVL